MEEPEVPFTVTILGFDHALSSAVTGAMDLFALASVSWQRIQQQTVKPRFRVQLASAHGNPVQCINHLTLTPHIAIEDVTHTDILLVPTIGGDITQVLAQTRSLHVHIRRLQKLGADIAGNCTGTFLLAEAGILDNCQATTHWGYAEQFRTRYPHIALNADKLVTQQDNVFCAGGGMAWFDLVLLLIERYCGRQVASDTAKSHVIDLTRPNQVAYAGSRQFKYHNDNDILAVQEYLDKHFQQTPGIARLARHHNMTERTLMRRFKQACGQTPTQYLQSIRIEQARKLLETQSWPLDKIIQQVGYEDASSFTRLFKRETGLSPSQYRAKFMR